MKKNVQISTALALLISSQAFAATDFISCPTFETIRANDHFSSLWVEDPVHNRWMLRSDIYKHNLAKWATYIAVPLPGVNDPADVTQKGTAYFREKVVLSTPTRVTDSTSTCCYYTSPEQEYAVFSITPPYASYRRQS